MATLADLQGLLRRGMANPNPYLQALQTAGLPTPSQEQINAVLSGQLGGIPQSAIDQYAAALQKAEAAPAGGTPARPPANLAAMKALISQGLTDPTKRNELIRAFQAAGLPVPSVEQARQFAAGTLPVDEATINKYYAAAQNVLPEPTDNPAVPAGGSANEIGRALQWQLSQLMGEDRTRWSGIIDRLLGIQTPQQMIDSRQFGSLRDSLVAQQHDALLRDAEQLIGNVPGLSMPATGRTLQQAGLPAPGDPNAILQTRTGSLGEQIAQRGGTRALSGPYAAMVGNVLNELQRQRSLASTSATGQAYNMMLQGQQQQIGAYGAAGQMASNPLNAISTLAPLYQGQRQLETQERLQREQLAAMARMGGGGGGGGGGSSAPSSTRIPNPYAGLTGEGGGSSSNPYLALASAAIPGLVGTLGRWLTGGGGGGGGGFTGTTLGEAPAINPSYTGVGSTTELPWWGSGSYTLGGGT